jgi:hypothetical protein
LLPLAPLEIKKIEFSERVEREKTQSSLKKTEIVNEDKDKEIRVASVVSIR